MNKFLVIAFLIISLGFYSCSGKSEGNVAVISDPKALGEEIGKNYDEMMDKLVAMLEEADGIEKLKQELAVLKEEYISIFVEYGNMREQLSETDKPKVDNAVISFNSNLDMDRFEKYSELVK